MLSTDEGLWEYQVVVKSIHAQNQTLSRIKYSRSGYCLYFSWYIPDEETDINNSVCRKIFYTLMGNMFTIISRVIKNKIAKVDGRIVVYVKTQKR